MEKKVDPSTPCAAYVEMASKWSKIQTLLDGTASMRAAGERYLPKHENEKPDAYYARRISSVLKNVAQQTLDSWVGRPFSVPVKTDDDVPPEIRALLDDIDLRGNDVAVFARDWFKEGISKAFAHVLVDFPYVDRTGRTLADDRRDGLRPYWSLIRPENLVFASSQMIGSKEVLTHVRIVETTVERDGFREKTVVRVRVFDWSPGGVAVTLWRLGDKRKWKVEEPSRPIDIDVIPIVTFYADHKGLLLGKPPIEDLVDLNIQHWQSRSDQTNILTVARFPILALSGGTEEESTVVIGPKKMLFCPDPAGKFYYVEHSGAAIGAGRQDLLDLEDAMTEYGTEFLKQRPSRETATARTLDSAEATSPLQDAVRRFNDSMTQALYLTAKWMGIEDGGHVRVNDDRGPDQASGADLQALGQARQMRDLSRVAYLREFKRRGLLVDTFDLGKNDEELNTEDQPVVGK
jgi:hypothetical protein